MTSAPQDDRRPRRRAAWWIAVPLALLVGVNVLVLVAADRDDDGADLGATVVDGAGTADDLLAGLGAGTAAGANGGFGADDGSGAPPDDGITPGAPRTVSGTAVADAADGAAGEPVFGEPLDEARPNGAGLNLRSVVDGPLRPGVPRTVTVTIRNGHPWPVHLLRTDVGALAPDTAPDCLPEWVSAQRYRYAGDGDRIVIGPQSEVELQLDLELMDLDVDQNACKGATIPLQLSAVAAEIVG
jgi:hypothetical protein